MTPNTKRKADRELLLTGNEAELMTGLRAREVFRPAAESECGLDVYPRNPAMRYQLGKQKSELRTQPRIEGMRDRFEGNVDIFTLVAYGRSWWDAVQVARAKGYPME